MHQKQIAGIIGAVLVVKLLIDSEHIKGQHAN